MNRRDDAFYVPLAGLKVGDARIYLGMIHRIDTLTERPSVVLKFPPEFSLGADCGFGRTRPAQLPQTLDEHIDALEIAKRS